MYACVKERSSKLNLLTLLTLPLLALDFFLFLISGACSTKVSCQLSGVVVVGRPA
jgi:hypothetical protein